MRYLAVDLGDKRTGLAMGDPVTGFVTPLVVLEVPISADKGKELLRAIRNYADRHAGPGDTVVLGLPLHMDGTESPRSKAARVFGELLREHLGRPVVYHDERLTSVEAEWELNGSGLTHGQKKRKRDALAAAALLRSYFDELGRAGAEKCPNWDPEPGGTSESESEP